MEKPESGGLETMTRARRILLKILSQGDQEISEGKSLSHVDVVKRVEERIADLERG